MRVSFYVCFNLDDSVGPYEKIEDAVYAYVSAAKDHQDARLIAKVEIDSKRQTAFPPMELNSVMVLIHELLKGKNS